MIKSVIFKKNYELSLEKENQKRWGVKTYKPNAYSREEEPWKMFTLFKKGLQIDFREGVNVVVGDNGSGKSTLFKLIKAYAGKAPDRLTLAFGNYNSEEEYLKYHKDNYRGELQIDGEIDYRNSVFFDAEEDNPLVAIPKMMTPSNTPIMASQLWDAAEESHGESMLPILEYLLTKAKDRILFFDEPETALSLRNQIWLSKALVESAENNHNQIVISTHALAVIQQFDEVFDMETRKWVNRETYVNDMITKKFNKNGRRNKNNR